MNENSAGQGPLEPTVRRQLTRRQAEVLRFVLGGGKVCADYLGGQAEDPENWDFAAWLPDGVDRCPRAARALLRCELVKIGEPNELGYAFLTPNARGKPRRQASA